MIAATASQPVCRIRLLDLPGLSFVLKIEGSESETASALLQSSGTQELVAASIASALSSLSTVHLGDSGSSSDQRIFTAGPAVPSSQVLRLAKKLRTGSDEDKVGRIRSAYQLGRSDSSSALLVDAPGFDSDSTSCCIFVILRSSQNSSSFWTRSKSKFLEVTQPAGIPDPRAQSRSFASQAELESYLSGLGAVPPINEQ